MMPDKQPKKINDDFSFCILPPVLLERSLIGRTRSRSKHHRSDPEPDESRHDVAGTGPLLAHLLRAGPLHPLNSARLLHPLRRGPGPHHLLSLCAEAPFRSVAVHGLKCVCLRQTLAGPRPSSSPPSWHSPAWSSSACPLCACSLLSRHVATRDLQCN